MEKFINDDYKIVLNNILEYFYNKCNDGYIPALINQGNLIYDGYELYMKLILVPQGYDVKNTWVKNNLLKSIDEDQIINVIVQYNYKGNVVYGLNGYLMDENQIIIMDQDDLNIMNLAYEETGKIKRLDVLKYDNSNVYILLRSLENYAAVYDRYGFDLFVEFEYRIYDDKVIAKNSKFKLENGFLELIFNFNKEKNTNLYWLLGTVKLDIDRLVKNDKRIDTSFSVVDLSSGETRNLNPNNYNDDTEAGLVVFSKEAVEILKKYYLFYDLTLISKNQGISDCMVDIIDDVVVFWEGEFNSKIPSEIKECLKKFNISNKHDNIISKPMFESQLQSNWNFDQYLLPNQKLASKIRSKYMKLAVEKELDFYPPQNLSEYSKFIEVLFSVLKIEIEDLKLEYSNELMLKKIISCEYIFNNYNKMYDNYQAFCLFISSKVLKDE